MLTLHMKECERRYLKTNEQMIDELIKLLKLLFIPKLEVEIVEDPDPAPNKVWVFKLPVKLIFLIVLLVAPLIGEAMDCNQITALAVLVLVLIMVRSLEALTKGQTVLTVEPIEPSIVTQSAPLKTKIPDAEEPVIIVFANVVLIVSVFVELAKRFELMVNGKVSLAEYNGSIKLKVTGPVRHAALYAAIAAVKVG